MISSRAGESAPPVSCVATAIDSAPSTVERWVTQPGAVRQSNLNAATTPQTNAAIPIGSVGVTTLPAAPGSSGSSVVTTAPTMNIQPTIRPATGRSSGTATPTA